MSSQSFSRLKQFKIQEIKFSPPPGLSLENLSQVFVGVLKGLDFIQVMPQAAVKKTLNITEKIEKIKSLIINNFKINFRNLLGQSKDRTEMIVNFLAVLELIKQEVVTVRQDKIFEDITIEKI